MSASETRASKQWDALKRSGVVQERHAVLASGLHTGEVINARAAEQWLMDEVFQDLGQYALSVRPDVMVGVPHGADHFVEYIAPMLHASPPYDLRVRPVKIEKGPGGRVIPPGAVRRGGCVHDGRQLGEDMPCAYERWSDYRREVRGFQPLLSRWTCRTARSSVLHSSRDCRLRLGSVPSVRVRCPARKSTIPEEDPVLTGSSHFNAWYNYEGKYRIFMKRLRRPDIHYPHPSFHYPFRKKSFDPRSLAYMSPLQIGALTGVISATISLAIFVIFLIAISFPFNTHAEKQTVIVEEGMSMEEIAVLLREDGFIGSYRMFMAHALLSGKSRSLQAGVYDLSASFSIREIVNILSGGDVASFVRVKLLEGYTIADMDKRLAEQGVLEEGEFIAATSISAADAYSLYDYEFLNGIESDTLEGFMFPDTYEFRKASKPRVVVDKFLFNFEYRTEELRAQVGNGPALYETMIIAGLIEEEMDITSDMYKVSSVIQNRIKRGMALQIDATLIYISGKPGGSLVNSDKRIDSPYNTYMYEGLPPGPITNPGLRALVAAANPADTPYIFYMSAPNGTSYFSTNLAQHNAYVARYLR